MRITKNILAALLLMGVAGGAKAQLTIQPNVPQAGLLQKSQLWNISAVYIGTDNPEAVIELTLTDRNTGLPFLTASSSAVTFTKGVKLITEATAGPITWQYVNAAGGVDNSGLLPAGRYQACYRVVYITQKKEPAAEECLPVDAEAMSPPLLNLPEDSAVLDNRYPQFVWLPPTPVNIFPDLQYDLLVTEILPKQSPQEALQRNMSTYSVSGLRQNNAVYPSSMPMLDTGKYYAWQVVARNGSSYGAKSETWVFKVSENIPVVKHVPVFYARLSKKIYDAVYPLTSPLRVEFVNEADAAEGTLELAGSRNGKPVVLESKPVKLKPGQNFLVWKLETANTDETLTLTIKTNKGETWGCTLAPVK